MWLLLDENRCGLAFKKDSGRYCDVEVGSLSFVCFVKKLWNSMKLSLSRKTNTSGHLFLDFVVITFFLH